MKKVSTAVRQQGRFLSQPTRTIGLDLGDRNSWYCVLDEAGLIQLEQRVRTNAQALREVFVAMPRSRVALETATLRRDERLRGRAARVRLIARLARILSKGPSAKTCSCRRMINFDQSLLRLTS